MPNANTASRTSTQQSAHTSPGQGTEPLNGGRSQCNPSTWQLGSTSGDPTREASSPHNRAPGGPAQPQRRATHGRSRPVPQAKEKAQGDPKPEGHEPTPTRQRQAPQHPGRNPRPTNHEMDRPSTRPKAAARSPIHPRLLDHLRISPPGRIQGTHPRLTRPRGTQDPLPTEQDPRGRATALVHIGVSGIDEVL
nr:salivary acidic proline-rich phosphoprotein 1/2-like [Nerophis lumbriciformis]